MLFCTDPQTYSLRFRNASSCAMRRDPWSEELHVRRASAASTRLPKTECEFGACHGRSPVCSGGFLFMSVLFMSFVWGVDSNIMDFSPLFPNLWHVSGWFGRLATPVKADQLLLISRTMITSTPDRIWSLLLVSSSFFISWFNALASNAQMLITEPPGTVGLYSRPIHPCDHVDEILNATVDEATRCFGKISVT